MKKLTVFNIDSNMPCFETCFKKYQVPSAKLSAFNLFADLRLDFGGTGQLKSKLISVREIHQARTINPPSGKATIHIAGALPLLILNVEFTLYLIGVVQIGFTGIQNNSGLTG